MDIVKLRTMTLKSRFDGGKYMNQTVETVLALNKQYLVYEYFKMSKISFTGDVLEAIGITDNFRIEKPGTNAEMLHKFNKNNIQKLTDDERFKHFIVKKKERITKAKLLHARHVNDEKRIFSKQSLKDMNGQTMKINLTYRSVNGKPFTK